MRAGARAPFITFRLSSPQVNLLIHRYQIEKSRGLSQLWSKFEIIGGNKSRGARSAPERGYKFQKNITIRGSWRYLIIPSGASDVNGFGFKLAAPTIKDSGAFICHI